MKSKEMLETCRLSRIWTLSAFQPSDLSSSSANLQSYIKIYYSRTLGMHMCMFHMPGTPNDLFFVIRPWPLLFGHYGVRGLLTQFFGCYDC